MGQALTILQVRTQRLYTSGAESVLATWALLVFIHNARGVYSDYSGYSHERKHYCNSHDHYRRQ